MTASASRQPSHRDVPVGNDELRTNEIGVHGLEYPIDRGAAFQLYAAGIAGLNRESQ